MNTDEYMRWMRGIATGATTATEARTRKEHMAVSLAISFIVGLITGYFIWGIWPSWPLIKQLFYSCL